MKNVYIGKKSSNGKTLEICKVIDNDIKTGNILVYNRETDKVEIISFLNKQTLDENIKKLAEDTENDYKVKCKKAYKKFINNFILNTVDFAEGIQ